MQSHSPRQPAAHGCVTGAVSSLVKDFFGTSNVNIVITSQVFSPPHTHTFNNTADWLNEVFSARIYAGFHYRHSLEDGTSLGHEVADQLFQNYFQPQNAQQ